VLDHSSNGDDGGGDGRGSGADRRRLFIGQSNEFFQLLQDLASEADAAQRGF
jgi:hypothetical protein